MSNVSTRKSGFLPNHPDAVKSQFPEGAEARQREMDEHMQKKIQKAEEAAKRRKKKGNGSDERTESPLPNFATQQDEKELILPISTATDEELNGVPESYKTLLLGDEDSVTSMNDQIVRRESVEESACKLRACGTPVEVASELSLAEHMEKVLAQGKVLVKGILKVETKSFDMELEYLDLSVSQDSVVVVMKRQQLLARLKNMESVYVHVDGKKIFCMSMMDPHNMEFLPLMIMSFFRMDSLPADVKSEPKSEEPEVISELANSGSSE